MSDEIVFRFVGPKDANGNPTEWYPGIPARDLTAADVARIERNGLGKELKALPSYKAVEKPATKKSDTVKGGDSNG
jgi:hypothetical protein